MEKHEENKPEAKVMPDLKDSPEAKVKTEVKDTPLPESAVQAAPAQSRKRELSRMRRFWRASLIWLAVVAISFTAGLLIFNFMRYQPQVKELTQAYRTTTDLQNQVNSLTSQLNTATDRLAVLEDVQTHLELLQVLSDVNIARLALIEEDVAAAKAVLENTSGRLETLAPKISAADASLVASLPQRLELILSLMENDANTAKVDLKLLAGSLLDIETALFDN